MLKIPKSSSCLQSKNVHDLILKQRMCRRFSVVGGDEPMNMILRRSVNRLYGESAGSLGGSCKGSKISR